MRLTLIITVLLSFVCFSCQKDSSVEAQPDKVAITINSPVKDNIVEKGDTVKIIANVQYISRLHGYELTLTDNNTGNVLYKKEDHTHDDHFSINDFWVDTLSNESTIKLKLTTVIDHEGNIAEKEVEFKNQR